MTTTSRSMVVLGMMTKMPVPGVIWQTLHYLVGLRRLGYEVTYVEAHARTPSMFVEGTPDAGSRRAAGFLDRVLAPHGLGARWAFHALHHDGALLGMDRGALERAYASAELILNLCGGTRPRDEHVDTGRLALVLTDPVQLEIELWQDQAATREFLDAHAVAFTFGENYGRPGCELPVVAGYDPAPTRQPVILDFWEHELPDTGTYTTVANWHQPFRTLTYRRQVYTWSKDLEFRKFLDLPRRTARSFELALASYEPGDRRLLEEHGWAVREAADFGFEGERYRAYVQGSRGEFTVAKDQNVRLRSGWFSDRSATYLAAGRPVVTQDTGFGDVLPTGKGLHAVLDVEAAAGAVETIEADYAAARSAAREVARACFDYRVVLPRMLADAGVEGPARRFPLRAPRGVASPGGEERCGPGSKAAVPSVPAELVIEPLSRRPLRLPPETVRTLLSRPIPDAWARDVDEAPEHAGTVSVIVVTYGGLALTRLCLETLLAHTRHPAYEVVVVDNASPDDTPAWLIELAAVHPQVRLILNPSNEGFAAACNQGARAARGDVLVFLNNDTIVAPGWLVDLVAPLADPSVGAVNPVTNRSGTQAEVGGTPDRTVGEFLRHAAERRGVQQVRLRAASMLAFFCLALRRDTWEKVGELDEGYGTGLFEDDDYSMRILRSGLRLACVEGVLVHHFGEASFGELVPDGRYARLYERNRARFQEKWRTAWAPRAERPDPDYDALIRRVRQEVRRLVPEGATLAVLSRGDERLLSVDPVAAWHFPRQPDGTYAGHYPADGAEAVRQLRTVQRLGADHFLVPAPAFWWLDHYEELRRFLERPGAVVARSRDLILYRLEQRNGGDPADVADRAADPTTPTAPAIARQARTAGAEAPEVGYAQATPPARPVLIIGSPRSGTSVLTWALGQHPNLYPLEETVWFGRFYAGATQAFHIGSARGPRSHLSSMGISRAEFLESLGLAVDGLVRRHRVWPTEPLGPEQRYATARAPHDPKERWVDGTPENSFHAEEIAELFPGATFIHLLREPDPVVRSLRRFHTIGGPEHSADAGYREWVAHVRACLAAEQALGPERVLRVLHRDLVVDPERVVRACLDFVGEPYAADCLLPLGEKINSSGDGPSPEGGAAEDEPTPEILAEAHALAAELFGMEEVPG